jgi:hypothetical protein
MENQMPDLKFISDYPVGTKLKVKFLGCEPGGWRDYQQKWIDANKGKTLFGHVEWTDDSMYFRPNRSKYIILNDDEIEILEKV